MGKFSKKLKNKASRFHGRVKEHKGEFKFVIIVLMLGAFVLLFQNCTNFSVSL